MDDDSLTNRAWRSKNPGSGVANLSPVSETTHKGYVHWLRTMESFGETQGGSNQTIQARKVACSRQLDDEFCTLGPTRLKHVARGTLLENPTVLLIRSR